MTAQVMIMSGVDLRHLFRDVLCSVSLVAVAATGCGGRMEGTGRNSDGAGGSSTGGSAGGGAGGAAALAGGAGGTTVGATGGAGGTTGGTGGAAGGTTGGTGGSTSVQPDPFWPDLSLADFTQPVCENGTYRMTAGLNPAYPYDYIAFRVLHAYEQLPDGGGTYSDVLDETGTDCSTAIYLSMCLMAIGMTDMTLTLGESCGGPPYPCQHSLVWTEGDSH